MSKYIDREELIRDIISDMALFMGTPDDVQKHDEQCNRAISYIESATGADVAPVVHGWWESVDSSYWRWTPSGAVSVSHITYRCGRCGRGTVVKTSYCPNCGAKMNGDGNADH